MGHKPHGAEQGQTDTKGAVGQRHGSLQIPNTLTAPRQIGRLLK